MEASRQGRQWSTVVDSGDRVDSGSKSIGLIVETSQQGRQTTRKREHSLKTYMYQEWLAERQWCMVVQVAALPNYRIITARVKVTPKAPTAKSSEHYATQVVCFLAHGTTTTVAMVVGNAVGIVA